MDYVSDYLSSITKDCLLSPGNARIKRSEISLSFRSPLLYSMPGLQREIVHEYTGKPNDNGVRGRLKICRVTLGSAAVQPGYDILPSVAAPVILNSGHNIPRIGLGTWKSEKGQVRSAVYEAVKAGYRHVDCAAIYENEHEVGSALQQAFSEHLIRRQDIFLTSKLWYGHQDTLLWYLCITFVCCLCEREAVPLCTFNC